MTKAVGDRMNAEVQPALDRLREAASRFFAIVESAEALPPAELLLRVNGCLPELYSRALSLPDVESGGSDVGPKSRTHEEWVALFNLLRKKLGSFDGYWDIFDSTERDEPVQGSLADDIADIYFDLKAGLDPAWRGTPSDVVWEIRILFFSHWGAHLTGALKAIHDLRARESLIDAPPHSSTQNDP